jgi:RNA-binding protein YhbY
MSTKLKYKPFILPSDFNELETYVISNKTGLTEKVVSSIEFALKNNLTVVEVFNFKNSDFIITISKSEFRENIQNIYNFYLKEELYELCGRVKEVELLLDKKPKTNEKKPKTNRHESDNSTKK